MNNFLSEAFGRNEKDLQAEIVVNPELKQEVEIQKAVFGLAAKDNAGITIPEEVTSSVMNAIGATNRRFFIPIWGIALLIVLVLGIGTLGFTPLGKSILSAFNTQNSVSTQEFQAITNPQNSHSLPKDKYVNYASGTDAVYSNSYVTLIDNINNTTNTSSEKFSDGRNTASIQAHKNYSSDMLGKQNKNFNDNIDSVKGNSKSNSAPNQGDITSLLHLIENDVTLDFFTSISSIASSIFASDNNSLSKFSNQNFGKPRLVNSTFIFNGRPTFIDNTKWSFAVNYFPTNQNVVALEKESYANTSFRAGYRINQNSTFGLELGFDNYNQQFASDYGKERYNQTPLLFYYGAYWRYSPEKLSIGTRVFPYMQAFGGGTIVGPIAKGSVGTKIRVFGNFYVNVGAEYGMLLYNVEDILYHSDKYGLTFGLQLNY